MPTTRATLISAEPYSSEQPASEWLEAGRESIADERVGEALRELNRVLHAHRVAAADPLAREVSRSQALVARLGYGSGEDVADGRWIAANDLPPPGRPRQRREAVLRPQERLAALLGARNPLLISEELALRARTDLDHQRPREAALQLRVALEAALAELANVDDADVERRLDELRETRAGVGEAANQALSGDLPSDTVKRVEDVLRKLEGVLRARAMAIL
ncbi:MAG TPA: hypothetical protein VHE14_04160 [Solirubrobacteraceae bacterium]|nr:hypothetical protein [Solirubrobacteraceae bacterium]